MSRYNELAKARDVALDTHMDTVAYLADLTSRRDVAPSMLLAARAAERIARTARRTAFVAALDELCSITHGHAPDHAPADDYLDRSEAEYGTPEPSQPSTR